MEILTTLLGNYYGLDWVCMAMGFYGGWLITNKNHYGFVFTMLSMFIAMIVAIMAGQYGFIFANLINIFIAIRGLTLWTREAQTESPATC